MSQLREIYDGKYDKHTGTGDDIGWTGKIGVIAGVTEVVYEYMESMSAMGDRFIMYGMEQPDRRKLLDFVLELDEEGKEDSRTQYENLRFLYQSYLRILNMQITHERITFDTESKEDIKNVADFCTKARSGVVEDFRTGAVKFVPSKEMPTRMVKQLLAIASGLVLIRKADGDIDKDKPGQLQQSELNMLYKIAFDSIPIKRRMALRYLTKYSQGVITEGLAMKLNYQTDVVRAWLSQLNALGIVKRVKENAKDKWSLRPEYQELMSKFNDIKILDEGLGADSDSDMDEEADEEWERGKGMMTDEELEAKLHYEMEAANQFESLANYDKENEQSKRDDERRETNKSETF